ncbi:MULTISPECIES: DUF3127 domain-containing protein [Flammeovirga]|uniref:DUF3127 domain-containing protein n=2 Tax=Flammeovirga TaxID=59739 RepID=A0A3Q9FMU1_9BACT|nr:MULTISPECIES: DUF3127 domain-containing protein [Flammeovirga]AZQ62266.1 DUF3127 domain-containing protein [Flammeovirga pectinis]MBB6461183.1 hypothetical protein [Flammeovirga kamogawensis]QWG07747.1 DUF3127 domain-containing protein [Flammeovirga kamogawensis]TRX69553.1 DUF3127 domain-containing protein [Flammeovirga kamogawensis]
MAFEVVGKIEKIMDTQQVSDRFKKRDFVLLIQDGSYPQYIKFQATQDRCTLLDSFNEGDDIAVTFDLKGRPFDKGGETIYFTNLEAWRINAAASAQPQAAPQQPSYGGGAPVQSNTPPPPPPPVGGDDIDGDLPF